MHPLRPLGLAILALITAPAFAASLPTLPHPPITSTGGPQFSPLPAKLTGLNAPNSAQVNDPVTFTLTGSGDTSKCQVHFDAGNGTAYDSWLNGGWFGHYVKYAAPGTYNVKINALQGCSGHVEKTVTITAAPTPPAPAPATLFNDIVVSPASPIAGLDASIAFKANGSTQGCHVKLDFGDGPAYEAFTNGQNPVERTHKYAAPGTYTLKAEGLYGCAGQVSKTITVTAPAAGQSTSGSAPWNGAGGYKPATIQKITLITQPPYTAGQPIQWMTEGEEGAACGVTVAFPSNGNQQISLTIVPQSQPTGNGKSHLGVTHWEPGQFIKSGLATFQVLPDSSAQTPCLGGATTTVQVQ